MGSSPTEAPSTSAPRHFKPRPLAVLALPRPRQRAEASARAGGRRARAAGTAADERRRALATRGRKKARAPRRAARSRAESTRALRGTSGWNPRRCARREGGQAERPATNAHAAALRASELHARRAPRRRRAPGRRRADRAGPLGFARAEHAKLSPCRRPCRAAARHERRRSDGRQTSESPTGRRRQRLDPRVPHVPLARFSWPTFWGERGARAAPLPSRRSAALSRERGEREARCSTACRWAALPLEAPSLASRAAAERGQAGALELA
jgi:hypothetical protein